MDTEMKKKGYVMQYVILWLLLAAVVGAIWAVENKGAPASAPPAPTAAAPEITATPSPAPSAAPDADPTAAPENMEMKGIWVPYMSLQSSGGDDFKTRYQEILTKAKEAGATALFVHVRPFCDALYPSELYPWSHLIDGKQGDAPDYDPLKFMIDATHESGMEFHAWLNPMRVKTSETPKEFSENNPYSKMKTDKPYYFIETASGIYLNPCYSEIRELISGGIREIVENYDVDGIHFDDYFYPSDMGSEDELAYMSYLDTADSPLSLEDWRIANINAMVAESYRAAKSGGKDIEFGISPQGNPDNNARLGADVEEWCATSGYIDYICPQIYFSYENPALGFSDALDKWNSIECHENLKKYIGLALYKVGTDSDSGTWPQDTEIIDKQIADAENSGADGVILYDIASIDKMLG